MRILERLKIKPFAVERVTWSDIQRLESKLKSELPELYVEFLLTFNGGIPKLNTFCSGNRSYIVNNFFYLNIGDHRVPDELSTEEVLWNYNNLCSALPTRYFPFARDPGDDLFCLDLDHSRESPVLYWPHESSEPTFIHLTNDFETFLDHLGA